MTPLKIELRLVEAGLVGFCGLTSEVGDFLALLARLGLGVSDWVGRIQAEEEEVEEEEDGEQVVNGLFMKRNLRFL